MAWVQGADRYGTPAWINTETGAVSYLPPEDNIPVPVIPSTPSTPIPVVPSESGPRIATIHDVYAAFMDIGGRNPVFETGEHIPFVGMEYGAMRIAVGRYLYPNEPAPIGVAPLPPATTPPVTTPVAVGGDIVQQVLQKALDALKAIQVIKTELEAAIKARVAAALPGLATALETIQRQLNTNILTLIPNTISLVGAALGGVETLLATFLSNAADIGDIADMAIDAVSSQKGGIAGWIMDLVVGPDFNLAGEVGAKITNAFTPDGEDTTAAVGFVSSIVPAPPMVDF